MTGMRSLARWLVVVAFFCALVWADRAPVFDHSAAANASVAASADGRSSGFKSQPAPEKPVYIGPGAAISGPTFTSVLVLSSALSAWHLPRRSVTPSSPALLASRLSPHLRSIPLLI